MSDRDASLDEASNIAFKALKEKPPAKPVDIYYTRQMSDRSWRRPLRKQSGGLFLGRA